jgi:hypothetical protein
MQGRGEAGVRAQAHAETLVRLAGAGLRDDALKVERQIDELAGLAFDMLRAHSTESMIAWVKEAHVGPYKTHTLPPEVFEPPAPGLIGVSVVPALMTGRYKVAVDGHSASPAFSKEERQLAFDLNARKAIDEEGLLEATHPPHVDERIADIETRKAEQAAFIAQHPELLMRGRKH